MESQQNELVVTMEQNKNLASQIISKIIVTDKMSKAESDLLKRTLKSYIHNMNEYIEFIKNKLNIEKEIQVKVKRQRKNKSTS